jgi:hypothetical protein
MAWSSVRNNVGYKSWQVKIRVKGEDKHKLADLFVYASRLDEEEEFANFLHLSHWQPSI